MRGRRGTNSHPHTHTCVAGVAQTHIHRRFAWQAWHSWHWVARLDWLGRPWRPGRRGTLRGRRGTNSHPPSFCVAGVAQPHIHRRFAWQAWRAWTGLVARDARDAAALCVAGVAQPHIHRRFAWQAWHSWHWVARLDWLGRPWRPGRRGTLRGRRGTNSHPSSFCVAGVAFAWQAWHSWHWAARLDWLGRPWRPGRRGTLRGRRGTNSHPPSFCVAGVAQTHIHRRFAWQAWHSWHWVARLDWLGRPWRPGRRGTLRGRRGTSSHPPSFCVAGVAQTHIHRRFAWQAWHSWHWVAHLDWLGRPGRRGTLRDRRGTTSHPPSFCVAGVAQTHILRRFAWQAWHNLTSTVVLRGRRAALGLAWSPVTPGTPRHFAWQAWHKLTSTVVLRGRHGICVAGVALMALGGALGLAWSPVTPGTSRHFAWQAWHKLTSTVVLRGRRGTTSHPLSFCVAGVALTHTHTHTQALCSRENCEQGQFTLV